MTTDPADGPNDDILSAVASLRTPDVSQRRARRLRRRCHALLQARPGPKESAAVVKMMDGRAFQRVIGPALGGAWCLAYLVEIVRRAAAVYFATP
jgi:hypothetical protein